MPAGHWEQLIDPGALQLPREQHAPEPAALYVLNAQGWHRLLPGALKVFCAHGEHNEEPARLEVPAAHGRQKELLVLL